MTMASFCGRELLVGGLNVTTRRYRDLTARPISRRMPAQLGGRAKATFRHFYNYAHALSNEIGSSDYIRSEAHALGAAVSGYELEVRFCCAGSDGFVNWTGNTLGIRRTANVIRDGKDGVDFRIVGSARELEDLIRDRAAQGHSARAAPGDRSGPDRPYEVRRPLSMEDPIFRRW